MTDIVEVKSWGPHRGLGFAVEVNSLETLQRLADTFNVPVILKKGKKEYVFPLGVVWFYYKE